MEHTETTQTTTTEMRGCGSTGCLCAGTGPAVSSVVTNLLKELGPSEAVRTHFRQARVEVLKGLRAILDQRINDLQKQPSRGVKVTID